MCGLGGRGKTRPRAVHLPFPVGDANYPICFRTVDKRAGLRGADDASSRSVLTVDHHTENGRHPQQRAKSLISSLLASEFENWSQRVSPSVSDIELEYYAKSTVAKSLHTPQKVDELTNETGYTLSMRMASQNYK